MSNFKLYCIMCSKSFIKRLEDSGLNPKMVIKPCNFVLIHSYLDSGFRSIVAFSDSILELQEISFSHYRFGSIRHSFDIYQNSDYELVYGIPLSDVKDKCLINICKNVAEYLAVGEYAMLKKSYFKSAAWFEKAKNSASLGADILDNY